ncbi:MAG TPA: hypothetical protein VE398_13630, partial [Acidobacteriota bacterium]|nr:hypothetical protein [Acidobacteriota bacterium]
MIRCLNAADVAIILFYLLLSFVSVFFASRLPYWWLPISINFGVIAYVFLVASLHCWTGNTLIRWLHDWN